MEIKETKSVSGGTAAEGVGNASDSGEGNASGQLLDKPYRDQPVISQETHEDDSASFTEGPSATQMVFQDGMAQPVFKYSNPRDEGYTNEHSELWRFCVYVESDYDTDLDGKCGHNGSRWAKDDHSRSWPGKLVRLCKLAGKQVGWTGVDSALTFGTTGQGRRLEAVRVNLTDDMKANYSVWYRVHSQTYGWLGWAKDGADAGSTGLAKRAEAIEIPLARWCFERD